MVDMKEMENIFGKMEHIIQVNGKMVYVMEREKNIMLMEILNMKVIGLMMILKEMENLFMKMVIIIQVYSKRVFHMEKENFFILMEILDMKAI